MATRTGRLSKPDSQGQYVRQLGWKLNSKGNRVQHKFRLGSDKVEAERRDAQLRQMWQRIENEGNGADAAWDELTLDVAKQVAKGTDRITLDPLKDEETPAAYAWRLQTIQDRFPFLRFAPSDEKRYTLGIGDKAVDQREIVLIDNPAERYWSQRDSSDLFVAPPLRPTGDEMVCSDETYLQRHAATYQPMHRPVDDGATLHQAMEAYIQWIREHYFDVDANDISEYAHTKIGQVETLKSRHDDVPLREVDYEYIEGMYRFWRRRPPKNTRNGEKERIARSSVRHYIGELHRFFKWLHRSRDFSWRKPEDFDEIDRSVPPDTETVKKRIRNVDTYRLEELRLLNRYATPIERTYLMLALNCGFGAKEIATLTIGEVFLHQALSPEEQESFDFPSTASDSFVTLVRNKTTIVGKYLLFGQTVQMLEWTMARRLRQPNPTADQRLILNNNGMPLDKRSENGNPSRQIPNSFARLKKRTRDDQNEISDLPFKCLRKTAGDLIRRFSDGEIAGVFLLHGQPVKTDKLSDVYTNRPFGKVYDAIRRVEEHLQPVFAEAGHEPTREQPQAYTSRRSIDRIAEMKRDGASVREIAAATGKSRMTVHRHIEKLRQRGELDE